MMTKRSTKNALWSSVLALFLCFTMLLGTTFAWFTDSVTSANNIITAGNLDIELYYMNDETTDWVKVGENTNIFKENALWEPGHTEVVKLKVVNAGTLALKYQLGVNVASETGSTNVAGNSFKLSDYIMYGIVDGEQNYTRDKAIAAVDADATALNEAYTSDIAVLAAGTESIVTMVVYMPTTVGNDANAKTGAAVPTINLGINLFATQANAESDSFGDDYDAGLNPPDEDGDILVEENGVQYYYTHDGEYLLYLVTEDYTEETFNVPEGVTTIGNYAFAYNTNVKEVVLSSTVRSLGRAFDSSTVEKVVLNEGLEQIDSRAFRSTSNLKEVVISSTVKTIADNAFQKSGIKEITIPATVETIGETAFGSSKIEKVTFEGNTSIQGYAFRGCPNLREVILKGDDVTFIASTLNGRNSMWFCNGESNNPNTSNITFYTENETVAARVKTAMGAEANNTKVYVDGKITVKVENTDALLSELTSAQPGTVIDATGLQTSISELGVVNGSYTTLNMYAGATIKGATIAFGTNTPILTNAGEQGQSEIVFENCTFTSAGYSDSVYFQSGSSDVKIVFKNCIFAAAKVIVADNNGAGVEYINCTFNLNDSGYGLVQAMGGNHVFNNCTFNISGSKSIGSSPITKYGQLNLYSERFSTVVTLNQCVNVPSIFQYRASTGTNTVVTNP